MTFIDDDDRYTSRESLATIAGYCTDPGVMPVWRIKREGGRIAPETGLERATWESAAFHTMHIPAALQFIEPVAGNDGDFWRAMSAFLRVEFHPEVLIEPQQSGRKAKGHGLRRDA